MTREHNTPAVEVLSSALARRARGALRALWSARWKRRYIRAFACVLYACASTPPPSREPPASVQPVAAARSSSGGELAGKLDPLPEMKKHGFDPRKYYNRRALYELNGIASYYGEAFAGRKTANGERFDPNAYTAAHRSLPFGTILRVTRKSTGDWVLVRINDRGPFGKRKRILDLSKQAARRLGMLHDGVAKVRAEVLEEGRGRRR